MKNPVLKYLILLILGILTSQLIEIPSKSLMIINIIILIYLYYIILTEKLNLKLLFLFIYLLGILIGSINYSSNLKNFENISLLIEGEIIDIGKEDDNKISYILKTKKINNKPIKEKIAINIYKGKKIKLGSNIIYKGNIKVPEENTNDKLFNYRNYLKSKKIYFMSVIDYSDLIKISRDKVNYKYKVREKFENRINIIFDRSLKELNSGFIKSIILGNTDYLLNEEVDKFRDLGLAHILAVSGLHIGIISNFITNIFIILGVNRKVRNIINIIIIWIYAFLIGFPPSILRGNIMISFKLIGEILHKPYEGLNILALSGLVLLIINPNYIYSVGFILSFVATLSILLINPRLRNYFYFVEFSFKNSILDMLGINIGILPVQIYYFNKISIYSIVINLILLPIFSLVINLSFLILLISNIKINISYYIAFILNYLLDLSFYIVNIFSNLPFNQIKGLSPNLYFILMYYLALLIIFKYIEIKNFKRYKRVFIYFSIFLIILNIGIGLSENMEIKFIDVGQGDSSLIRIYNKYYLIDTGGSIFDDYVGERILRPYLEKNGINSLEAVFISHFDEDHYKGLESILGQIKIGKIYVSYLPDKDIIRKILDQKIDLEILSKGDSVNLGRNIDFICLYPDRTIVDRKGSNLLALSDNDLSLVGILRYKNQNILYTGDIEEFGEREVLKTLKDNNISIDALKVAHHGSKTSSMEEFIDYIDGGRFIISVGRKNSYGHPNEEVINRLESKGRVYRTDELGLISLKYKRGELFLDSFIKSRYKRDTIYNLTKRNYIYLLVDIFFFIIIYREAKDNLSKKSLTNYDIINVENLTKR